MAKTISIKQVEKVGELSKLTLTVSEKKKLLKLFTETLNYVNVLNEINLRGVEETYQVTGLTNVFQKSGLPPTLSKEDALSNAKEVVRNLIATAQVLER